MLTKRNNLSISVLLYLIAAFCLSPSVFAAAEAVSASAQAAVSHSPAGGEDSPTDEGTITLDFKEADINTVLRVMSLKSKTNIVAGPEVQGNVTIRLENVPWEQALKVVLRTYGYVYERDGNIIRVTTRENLAQEPLVTQTYILNYSKAQEVQGAVQDILTERGRIKTSDRTNMLIITDIPTNLYNIGEVIKRVDRPTPAASIDAKIINTKVGVTENLGIEWKTGGINNNVASLTGSSRPTAFPFTASTSADSDPIGNAINQFFPITSTATNAENLRGFPNPGTAVTTPTSTYAYGTLSFSSFSAVLQMLKARSNTKVVSNPRIVVLNNQTATIHVGDNIPLPTFDTNANTGRLIVSGFNYDKLKTGVTMEVTPHINSKDEILVEVQPAVNAQGSNISFNTDLSAPIVNETTAKTQVLILSGQTIAIGGLMTDNAAMSEAKVPYLADVPIVGKLFRSKRQTAGSGNEKVETLFFITVTVVDSEGQPVKNINKSRAVGSASPSAAKSGDSADKKVANSNQIATEPETKGSESNAKSDQAKTAAA